MRLAILGASVSAQSKNHVTGLTTGYSQALMENHADQLGITEWQRFTYAGNRLSDGGIARSLELASFAPDIVIFEPNIEDVSRGEPVTRDEAMFVYGQIYKSGARPITLMLPNNSQPNPRVLKNYAFYRDICDELGAPLIEIDLSQIDRTGLLDGA